mmetsp:Transcript_50958/g.101346  ORF Transcript_50958/g.101346 Transcript_50958/m.101346 type:complete len:149 (+) Transcript_50958:342-788(+)
MLTHRGGHPLGSGRCSPCICCPYMCYAAHAYAALHMLPMHCPADTHAHPQALIAMLERLAFPSPDLALARPGPRQTWPSPGLIKVYTLIQALLTCTSAVGGAAAPSSFSELDEVETTGVTADMRRSASAKSILSAPSYPLGGLIICGS